MTGRRRKDPPLRLPRWLVDLLTAEGTEDFARKAEARLGAGGVGEVGCNGQEARPDEITFSHPRLSGRVGVDYAESRPVTDALGRLIEELAVVNDYLRLRLAEADMLSVATCARALAEHRHPIGAPDPIPHNPYAVVEDVLETGIVATYARNFTGAARLGDKWRPESDEDRQLHEALIARRSRVDAHADHTAHRSLVDTTKMLGMEGPPTLALTQTMMNRESLEAVAEMCDRQRERFTEAAKAIEPRVHSIMA